MRWVECLVVILFLLCGLIPYDRPNGKPCSFVPSMHCGLPSTPFCWFKSITFSFFLGGDSNSTPIVSQRMRSGYSCLHTYHCKLNDVSYFQSINDDQSTRPWILASEGTDSNYRVQEITSQINFLSFHDSCWTPSLSIHFRLISTIIPFVHSLNVYTHFTIAIINSQLQYFAKV